MPIPPWSWMAPSPITDFVLDKGANGFSWSRPVSGSGSLYYVLRSGDATDFYNATCVTPDTSLTSVPIDDADPAPGEVQFYLVGARSPCGLSTLGNNLDGTPRHGTVCDVETAW